MTRWAPAAAVLVLLAPSSPRPSSAQQVPTARAHHQLAYHEGDGRVYLIGGSTRREDGGSRYFDEVWAWDGSRWTLDSRLPFPRSSHRVAYHRTRGSLVLFGGGWSGAVRAEGVLWEWRSGRWTAQDGSFQAGRNEPGMCYDRRRDRVVLFGGWDFDGDFRGDTWVWDGDELMPADTAEAAPAPGPRSGHAFVWDPAGQRCLLLGGRGPEGYLADTWAWDGEGWALLPASGPRARSMGKMASTGDGVLLFGGRADTPEGFLDLNDTWELKEGSWRRR